MAESERVSTEASNVPIGQMPTENTFRHRTSAGRTVVMREPPMAGECVHSILLSMVVHDVSLVNAPHGSSGTRVKQRR
jgi:hypothetical protein